MCLVALISKRNVDVVPALLVSGFAAGHQKEHAVPTACRNNLVAVQVVWRSRQTMVSVPPQQAISWLQPPLYGRTSSRITARGVPRPVREARVVSIVKVRCRYGVSPGATDEVNHPVPGTTVLVPVTEVGGRELGRTSVSRRTW